MKTFITFRVGIIIKTTQNLRRIFWLHNGNRKHCKIYIFFLLYIAQNQNIPFSPNNLNFVVLFPIYLLKTTLPLLVALLRKLCFPLNMQIKGGISCAFFCEILTLVFKCSRTCPGKKGNGFCPPETNPFFLYALWFPRFPSFGRVIQFILFFWCRCLTSLNCKVDGRILFLVMRKMHFPTVYPLSGMYQSECGKMLKERFISV